MIKNWHQAYISTDLQHLLKETAHRPWEIPSGDWKYYQEWNEVLFFHWKVPAELLKPLIPEGLELDRFENEAWISLVPFTMQKISPAGLPPLAFISDFHEINLRTYVLVEGKPGVYFLNIEAQKHLSVWIAKQLSGLPYEKAVISRSKDIYRSQNDLKGFNLDIEFEVKDFITLKSKLDLWLTERYCLYLDREEKLFRYEIHHLEWQVAEVALKKIRINYHVNGFNLDSRTPDLIRYSPGVKVLAWTKKEIKT
ncbi:YqjF family protein [Pedobacter caeni]|uniref:DUF2071 domain-containing protein n=1 Tax=Pedobacter caeni TaxID=288992 RepID=A0A1M5HUK3_9SPHI|nr:DUF2071 domain-containing protein [Pedobacter caeni]SHG19577.1 hypothetical protein SAMN04488522_104818 [Pedobacter caeni]